MMHFCGRLRRYETRTKRVACIRLECELIVMLHTGSESDAQFHLGGVPKKRQAMSTDLTVVVPQILGQRKVHLSFNKMQTLKLLGLWQ